MSKIGVSLKIDVTKITKERLFKGEKGTYLDATVFINLDEADEFGQHGMIVESVSKEEREQQVQGPILGNVTIFWDDRGSVQGSSRQQPPQQPAHKPSTQPTDFGDLEDDIPW